MPDFAIDYALLEQVQKRMRDLAGTADSGGAQGALKELGDSSISEIKQVMGFSDVSGAMWNFAQRSSSRAKDAKDGLEKLAGIFESVADGYFQVDADMAGSAGVMGSSLGLDKWKQDKSDWERYDADTKTWNDFLKEIGADGYFKEHPDADINSVCSAEDAPGWCEAYNAHDDPPTAPGPPPDVPRPGDTPPTEYTIQTDAGSTHVKLTLDDDHNVMKEESTITAGDQSYSSVTTYDTAPQPITTPDGKSFDARDYTMVTTYPDGSQVTSRYVIADDGSGTMTVTDSDGTTEYTRSGPTEDWAESSD